MVEKKGLEDRLDTWRRVARETNNYFADELGINRSASITAVKPSGTVSQLTSSSSGNTCETL
jgi:hypothetical protein